MAFPAAAYEATTAATEGIAFVPAEKRIMIYHNAGLHTVDSDAPFLSMKKWGFLLQLRLGFGDSAKPLGA